MINVQLQPDGEITQADEAALVKNIITIDDENEYTVVTEYRLPGGERPVHRSVAIILKKPAVFADGDVGKF